MKICLLISFTLLLSSKLHATETTDDYFALSFKELMQIDVTGATLTSENLKTVPSSVTVFSYEEISRMGLDTLDELMNIVPGFQSYRSAFSSLAYPFSSRGRRIGNSSSEVLVLVDGQRLDSSRSSGSAVIVPKYPLMNIERVEFIRGPGAAVYGSNAMMGVVNIITRSNINELSVSYGSFNRKKVYLMASKQINDISIDLFANFDKDDGDDYRLQDTFSPNQIDTDDPRELADLNIKVNWNDTQINFQHNQFKSENFYEADGISNDINQRKANRTSISLKQTFDWQSVDSYFWLSYNHSSLEMHPQLSAPGAFSAISNPSSNDPLLINPEFDDYNEFRTQWHNDWVINSKSDLQFGFEYRHIDAPEATADNNYDLEALANRNFPISYYGNMDNSSPVQLESQRDIIGLYGQYQYQLFEMTHLTLGLRYDNFSGIDSQLSPRLGLVHKLDGNNSLKFLYGEAFRAPAENELYFLNNPRLLGNSDLTPETVETWELIWVGQWSETGISLGYFENHFKDSIVQANIGNGLLQYQNKDQDPSKGIELELTQEWNQHWLMRATYTNIYENNDLSYREADQLFSLMVNYEQGKWNANLIATYHNEREMATGGSDSNRIKLDSDWQLFGKLRYLFKSDLQGFIQVKNLLNEEHLTPASNAILTEGVSNRGREILIGMTWQF